MTYAQKLRDPRWQRKRLEVMEAAGWECEDCGRSDIPLHVHHKIYYKGAEPWDYETYDLACLCEECHKRQGEMKHRIDQFCCYYGLEILYSYALGYEERDPCGPPDALCPPEGVDELIWVEGVIGAGNARIDFFRANLDRLSEARLEWRRPKKRNAPLRAFLGGGDIP